MSRFRNLRTGVVFSVDDSKDSRYGDGFESAAGSSSGGYDSMKVADLKSEIERRNEGRDEADLLSADGKKADLVAALTADDEK